MLPIAEKDQVSWLQIGLADLLARMELLMSRTRQNNAELLDEGRLNKGRAVNTGSTLSSQSIRRTLPLVMLVIESTQDELLVRKL